jgi:hypothetical protein
MRLQPLAKALAWRIATAGKALETLDHNTLVVQC